MLLILVTIPGKVIAQEWNPWGKKTAVNIFFCQITVRSLSLLQELILSSSRPSSPLRSFQHYYSKRASASIRAVLADPTGTASPNRIAGVGESQCIGLRLVSSYTNHPIMSRKRLIMSLDLVRNPSDWIIIWFCDYFAIPRWKFGALGRIAIFKKSDFWEKLHVEAEAPNSSHTLTLEACGIHVLSSPSRGNFATWPRENQISWGTHPLVGSLPRQLMMDQFV